MSKTEVVTKLVRVAMFFFSGILAGHGYDKTEAESMFQAVAELIVAGAILLITYMISKKHDEKLLYTMPPLELNTGVSTNGT